MTTLQQNSNWLFPLSVVTINPEIVQFIRHLALTGHLTIMYKDSTNIGVNLTKGKSLTNPRINTYFVFKNRNFANLYVCFYLLLLCFADRQIHKVDYKILIICSYKQISLSLIALLQCMCPKKCRLYSVFALTSSK